MTDQNYLRDLDYLRSTSSTREDAPSNPPSPVRVVHDNEVLVERCDTPPFPDSPPASSVNLCPTESFESITEDASEESFTTIRVSRSVTFDSLEDKRHELSTHTFQESSGKLCDPSPSPTETEKASTKRLKPYRTWPARETENRNAEADPSPLQSQNGSCVDLPTGVVLSETNAGVGIDQLTTEEEEEEEEKPPEPKRARRDGGKVRERPYRKRAQSYARELCNLVKQWKGLDKVPPKNEALTEVLEYISTVRVAVYAQPCLAKGTLGTRPDALVATRREREATVRERERRDQERAIFEEVSRYYPLPENGNNGEGKSKSRWDRSALWKELLDDLRLRHPPPELVSNSAPSVPM